MLEPTEKFLILSDISLIFIGAIFATTVNKTIWVHSFYYLQNIIVSNGAMGRVIQHQRTSSFSYKNRCTCTKFRRAKSSKECPVYLTRKISKIASSRQVERTKK